MNIAERLAVVHARIEAATHRSGRSPGDVTLIGVTKTFGVDVVAAALDAGIVDLGENRAQELGDKLEAAGDRARWHFVGALQTNKVHAVVGRVSLIHSVDRLAVAEAIARRASSGDIVQDVLVEVNVAGEASKSGIALSEALDLARATAALEGLRLRGLMTIPPFPEDPEETRPYYASLAELGAELTAVLPGAGGLSMGMSRDFEVAIEEGATYVRVGEALFGPRSRRAKPA